MKLLCTSLLYTAPANLTHFHVDTTSSDGRKMPPVLRCEATGAPQPEIAWYRSGVKVDDDDVKLSKKKDGTYSSALTLKNGDNVGMYNCTVKNKYSKLQWHSFAPPTHKPVKRE